MRFEDIREGGQVFGKSVGHILAAIMSCAPAVVGYHIGGEFTGDWDWLAAAGGLALTCYLLAALLSHLGEERRHERALQEVFRRMEVEAALKKADKKQNA